MNSVPASPPRSGCANPKFGSQDGRAGVPETGWHLAGAKQVVLVARRDATWPAPGPYEKERYQLVEEGEERDVPRVTKNFAALLDMFAWNFGPFSKDPDTMDAAWSSALRFSERYASESGSKRFAGRAMLECPRASFFIADSPSYMPDGARRVYQPRVACYRTSCRRALVVFW